MNEEYTIADIREYMLRYSNALGEFICSKYDIRERINMSTDEFMKSINTKCTEFVNDNAKIYQEYEYKRK